MYPGGQVGRAARVVRMIIMLASSALVEDPSTPSEYREPPLGSAQNRINATPTVKHKLFAFIVVVNCRREVRKNKSRVLCLYHDDVFNTRKEFSQKRLKVKLFVYLIGF